MARDSYNYSKDRRSDEQLKRYYDRGVENQRIAARQFVWDKMMENPNHDIGIEENSDERFHVEGDWPYTPDFIGWFDDKIFPLEVKCSEREPKETFDLKQNQIKNLIRVGGYILYCTPSQYSFFPAKRVPMIGKRIISERLGGKPAWEVPTDAVKWQYWIHNPELKKYNGGFYEQILAQVN